MELTFNRYAMAKESMAQLSKDFLRIKKDQIDKGDYGGANSSWYSSRSESHFDTLKPYLKPLYMGPMFIALADQLTEALEQGDEFNIKWFSDRLLTCIKQQEMRAKLRPEDDLE